MSWNNTTSVVQVFFNANESSGGMFGVGVAYAFYLVMFITMFRNTGRVTTSLISSSFISLLVNIALMSLGLLSGVHIIVPLLVLAASVAIK